MLARIKSASFHGWVGPDQDMIIYGKVKINRNHFATAECYIEVNKTKVCNAELFFTFVPLDKFPPDYLDDVLESYVSENENAKIS